MKRWICMVLVMILLLTTVACADKKPSLQVPVEYFYPYSWDEIAYNGEPTMTKSELREAAGHQEELDYLLNQYFKGPENEKLRSPFPTNLTVVDYQINEETITLKLSKELSQLTGIDLTIACACITQTCLTMYPTCNKVHMTADENLLEGNRWIQMTRDTLMLLDSSTEPTSSESTTVAP